MFSGHILVLLREPNLTSEQKGNLVPRSLFFPFPGVLQGKGRRETLGMRLTKRVKVTTKIEFFIYFLGVARSHSWAVNQWQATAKKGKSRVYYYYIRDEAN